MKLFGSSLIFVISPRRLLISFHFMSYFLNYVGNSLTWLAYYYQSYFIKGFDYNLNFGRSNLDAYSQSRVKLSGIFINRPR